jgi:hypothetical protein
MPLTLLPPDLDGMMLSNLKRRNCTHDKYKIRMRTIYQTNGIGETKEELPGALGQPTCFLVPLVKRTVDALEDTDKSSGLPRTTVESGWVLVMVG